MTHRLLSLSLELSLLIEVETPECYWPPTTLYMHPLMWDDILAWGEVH